MIAHGNRCAIRIGGGFFHSRGMAAKIEGILGAAVDDLEGVGPARGRALRALGVETLGDLLEYFPRDYQRESAEAAIDQLRASEDIQSARGEVIAVNYIPARPRARFEATIADERGRCGAVWFNAAWMRSKVHPGAHVLLRGKVRFFRGIPQFTQPKFEIVEAVAVPLGVEDSFRLHPIYPASEQIPSEVIARVIEANLPKALEVVDEWFPEDLRSRRGLIGRRDAYRLIHRPATLREAMSARRRIMYDELMILQLGLGVGKRLREGRLAAPVLRADKLLDERIRRRFPFDLTEAQRRAVWEILHDIKSGRPMNRLLQGDVGSGKTVVALYAMLVAVANRMQSALLAPTEVLAEQHFLTMTSALKESSVRIGLFTHRTKQAARRKLQRDLADGVIHLAIGTQALIQEDMEFANLGLVVVDEQHRLGVRQRAHLKGKGMAPHYLVMTATPIPRTLALSYFADFDVTTIDELPPGRQPIGTRWLRRREEQQAYDFIRQQVALGRQAYIVLPQIQEDVTDDSRSVLREYERLKEGPLRGLRLGILHGQMATQEKQSAMAAFRDGEVDVLLATTVIEVGIDVPNATVIVIDNADRFGLSQLHQLRGRVGRGRHESHCLLIADADEEAAARLDAMVRTASGFKIAEMDLKLRGPGEFFGTRQHGLPEFKLADVTSEMGLLAAARDDALAILAQDPRLAGHPALRKALRRQIGDSVDLVAVG